MAVIARESITIYHVLDISSVTWFYQLVASTASTPAQPTTLNPPTGWTGTEPSFNEDSTQSLYVVERTIFSDGTFSYSDVSLSSSYEAAKSAYNRSIAAMDAVNNIEVGGRNLLLGTGTSYSSLENDPQYTPVYYISDYGKTLFDNTETEFTVSFDFEITGDYSGASSTSRIYAMLNGTSVSPGNSVYAKNLTSPTGHYKSTIKMTAAQLASSSRHFKARWNGIVSGCTFTVSNFKVELGNQETDWTPAPEDVAADISQVQTNLDNLKIGGRNLMSNTLVPNVSAVSKYPRLVGQTVDTSLRGYPTVAEHGIRSTNYTANWPYIRFGTSTLADASMHGLEAGETYTFSFDTDFKTLSGTPESTSDYIFGLYIYTSINGANFAFEEVIPIHTYSVSSLSDRGQAITNVRAECSFTIPINCTAIYIDVRTSQIVDGSTPSNTASNHDIGDYIELRNIKLEHGTCATDWTAAPEDSENPKPNGRNLIVGTLNPCNNTIYDRPHILGQNDPTRAVAAAGYSNAEHGFRAATTSATRAYIRMGLDTLASANLNGLTAGETYTLSFDASWKVLSGTTETTTRYMRVYCYYASASDTAWQSDIYHDFASVFPSDRGNEMSGRCEFTFTIPATATKVYFYICNNRATASNYKSGDYIEVRNLKLEVGDRATAWSAAPEDYDIIQDRKLHYGEILAAAAIPAGTVIVGTNSGYKPLTTSNVEFDLSYPILYSPEAIASGSTSTKTYEAFPNVTFTTSGTITSGGANSMLYLKGTISNGKFRVSNSPYLTTVAPTTNDGCFYIPLGLMTSSTLGYFLSSDRLFGYITDSFMSIDVVAQSIVADLITNRNGNTYFDLDNGVLVTSKYYPVDNLSTPEYEEVDAYSRTVLETGKFAHYIPYFNPLYAEPTLDEYPAVSIDNGFIGFQDPFYNTGLIQLGISYGQNNSMDGELWLDASNGVRSRSKFSAEQNIEIYHTDGASPYVDFHRTNNNNTDFTSRIISNADNQLQFEHSVGSKLQFRDGGIEIWARSGQKVPFIDFHHGDGSSSSDYDGRFCVTDTTKVIKAYASVSNASDEVLKDDIVPIDAKYLELIDDLKPRQFIFKNAGTRLHLGFIAQDVKDSLDEMGIEDKPLISEPANEDDYYGLDYSQIIPLLVMYCQDLRNEINQLKSRLGE